jgi:hypothetical protein
LSAKSCTVTTNTGALAARAKAAMRRNLVDMPRLADKLPLSRYIRAKMHALVHPRPWFCVCIVSATVLGCGRTDVLWWSDFYASDSGTDDEVGDGDGDGDDTIGTSSTSMSTSTTDEPETETGTSETSTTDTTDTTTSETDTSETDTDTTTGCEDVPVALTGVAPKVVFLLDQGAHMDADFAGLSRWQAIGEALFGMQAGVVWAWEDVEHLGLVSFTSNNGDQGGACPIAETVGPQLQNGAAMQMVHTGLAPADDNPAGEAIELAAALFNGEPGHLILLTGRTPDTCNSPNNMMQGASLAVTAAQAAFASGVTTRVVEVGDIAVGYAQQLANAGLGLAPQGPDSAPFWQPGDVATLTTDLDAILTSLASCELTLEPSLASGGEQLCSLTLDGMPATLGDPEGWNLAASDRITLAGAACQSFLQGATPDLVCACEAFD